MKFKDILSSAQAKTKIEELNERKNALTGKVEELRKAFETQTVEERENTLKDIEGVKNELTSVEGDLAELEERKTKLEDQEKRMSLVGNLNNITVRSNDKFDTPEYRSAYRKMLMGDDREFRALTSSTPNAPIPTYMQSRIEVAWNKYGHILERCNITNTRGIVAVPYEQSADDASYATEGTAHTEENLTLGQTLLQPLMVKKWIAITDELDAMTDEDFMNYIVDEVVYKIVSFIEAQIVGGEGKSEKGFIGVAKSKLAKEVKLAPSFNTVNLALAELRDDLQDPVVIMKKKTFMNEFMGLKDTAGRPIFLIQADNAGRPQYFLNGIPVLFTDGLKEYSVATADTDTYMIVGDMSAYRANFPDGKNVKLLLDPYTLAVEGKKRIIGNLFGAGDVVKPSRLVRVVKPNA